MTMDSCVNYFVLAKLFLAVTPLLSSWCMGFDICMEWTHKPNCTVFDSGIAACEDCQYTLDLLETNSSSLLTTELIGLNSSTGKLKLCYAPKTPIQLVKMDIIVKPQNLVESIVNEARMNLIITGRQDCKLKNTVPDSIGGALRMNADFVVSLTPRMFVVGSCLQFGSEMVHLGSLIPQSFLSCQINYELKDSSKRFLLNPFLGQLTMSSDFCISESLLNLTVAVNLKCKPSSSILSGSYVLTLMLNLDTKPLIKPNKVSNKSKIFQIDEGQTVVKSRARRASLNRAPSFLQKQYYYTVPEEDDPGFVVATITASDPDQGDAGKLTYSLLATKDGRSQAMFAVDRLTGTITTTRRLDRETMAEHHFRLIARDSGRPPMSAETLLTIHVKDVNDHKPVFENERYSKAVSEGVVVGTTVLTVRASDDDSEVNGEIEYSILNQSDVFEIDRYKGSILTKAMLDRKKKKVPTATLR